MPADTGRTARIDGYAADGFGPVADAFRATFADTDEVGAGRERCPMSGQAS